MSFLDRFLGRRESFNINRDFNINEKIIEYYGGKNNVKEAYSDISKTTKRKFIETLDMNDQILEKYAKDNKEDIQDQIMKKYLNLSQEDLNKQALEQVEKQQLEEQVNETLKDVDSATKDKVVTELEEQQKDIKNNPEELKKALETRIYEATYNTMYKDYADKVMAIKNMQYDAMAVNLTTKEAMEIIAMEKNLEKLDLLYHNHTGKDISEVERIKNNKQDFKEKFDYNQKGIENNTDERMSRINQLYAKRAEEYKKYIRALKDPSKTPQEKAMYKRAYEDANLDLIQNVPSLNEYVRNLDVQKENEKLIEDTTLKDKSAINARVGADAKVTDSKMADKIYGIENIEQKRDEETFENSMINQKDAIEKGDLETAKAIGDAQRDKGVYDKNVQEDHEEVTKTDVKEEVHEEKLDSDKDFFSSLKKVRNMDEMSQEELESVADDREKEVEEKLRENAHKEQLKKENEYELYRKQAKQKKNN